MINTPLDEGDFHFFHTIGMGRAASRSMWGMRQLFHKGDALGENPYLFHGPDPITFLEMYKKKS